jgi:hypothetical protein
MAVVLSMNFTGLGQREYDGVCAAINFPENIPDGLLVHLAGATSGGWRVIDCWESQQLFDRFLRDTLTPAMRQLNVLQPEVETITTHRVVTQRPLVQTT